MTAVLFLIMAWIEEGLMLFRNARRSSSVALSRCRQCFARFSCLSDDRKRICTLVPFLMHGSVFSFTFNTSLDVSLPCYIFSHGMSCSVYLTWFLYSMYPLSSYKKNKNLR